MVEWLTDQSGFEDVLLVELYTLCLLKCKLRVTVGSLGLCYCVRVMSFKLSCCWDNQLLVNWSLDYCSFFVIVAWLFCCFCFDHRLCMRIQSYRSVVAFVSEHFRGSLCLFFWKTNEIQTLHGSAPYHCYICCVRKTFFSMLRHHLRFTGLKSGGEPPKWMKKSKPSKRQHNTLTGSSEWLHLRKRGK